MSFSKTQKWGMVNKRGGVSKKVERIVCCDARKKKVDIPLDQIEHEMIIESVHFTSNVSNSFAEMQKLLNTQKSLPVKYGSGILAYNGFSNAEGYAFVGTNVSTKKTLVQLFKKEGVAILEKWRDAKQLGPGFQISLVEGVWHIKAPKDCMNSNDFLQQITELASSQMKARKACVVVDDELRIGSKSSGNFIIIKALTNRDLSIHSIQINVLLKQRYATKFFSYLLSNPTAGIEDVLAYCLLESLNVLTSTSLLQTILKKLQQEFSISQVVAVNLSKTSTKSANYLHRTLKAISNKLKDSSTSQETEEILVNWCNSLDQKILDKIGVSSSAATTTTSSTR